MGNKKKKPVFEDTRGYLPLECCENIDSLMKSCYPLSVDEILTCIVTVYNDLIDPSSRGVYAEEFLKDNPTLQVMKNQTKGDFDIVYFYNRLKWSEYKQVFTFDNTFFESLINTDNIKIQKDFWDYLPFNDFYIDFSNCPQVKDYLKANDFNKIEGIYISISKKSFALNYLDFYGESNKYYDLPENYFITYSLVGDTMDIRQQSGCLKIMNYDNEFTPDETKNPIKAKTSVEILKQSGSKTTHSPTISNNIFIMVSQILNYLAQEKPDIQLNEEMKHTFKPRPSKTNPRNRYSEVCKWNVGYRMGAEFRRWQKELSESELEDKSNFENDSKKQNSKPIRPIRPYIRRAHWHSYWYGPKGSQVKKAKWIQEVPVGFSYNFDTEKLNELPAVIRRIREKIPNYGLQNSDKEKHQKNNIDVER